MVRFNAYYTAVAFILEPLNRKSSTVIKYLHGRIRSHP